VNHSLHRTFDLSIADSSLPHGFITNKVPPSACPPRLAVP
jgi:hypothetical protein